MKHFYLLLVAIFFSVQLHSQNAPFITTWEVTAGSLGITIPTTGPGYNYDIDFGDGTTFTNKTGYSSHTYNAPGIYTVTISGNFPRIRFGDNYINDPKIKSVEQWGDIQWQTMELAFDSCINMVINATDAPDLSQVTNMSRMFSGTNSLYGSMNHWDVSNVTNMSFMFEASNFNQPINNWDVSNVVNMQRMFRWSSFNQQLDNWDVSNVIDMVGMFRSSSYNQSLDNWDVSSVIRMDYMFENSEYNKPLNSWNVSNVINMRGMFRSAKFNFPLNNWDVSSVTDMSYMFRSASFYNQPMNNWDVSNVVNMDSMFKNAQSFNQPIGNWDVTKVSTMTEMFHSASSYNQPMNNWDVLNVRFINGMFQNAQTFNQDLSNWQLINLVFSEPFNLFLSYSGMDIHNYDKFLNHMATLNLNYGKLGAHDLEYCSSGARDFLINMRHWTIIGDNFSPNCNLISGSVLYDQNNNGCDPNDIAGNDFMINANDGTYNWITSSNNGTFNLGVSGTNFTVSVVNQPSYFTVTPASVPVVFTTSQTEIVDFCVTANQIIEDLNIILLQTREARPGFEAKYRLVVKNVGTETIANVTATLEFDNSMQQFVVANPAPGSMTTNTLTFPIGTMQPFQNIEIDITMLTFQPPTVEGDDILNFIAEATPSGNDHTPNDNIYNLAQVVVNSYDPNDKLVLQGEELLIDDINEYLDYLIRFQNMGTASAINVRILDTLHPKLDWNTLQPISASHDYYVKITDGNSVEFMFDNIHLPHEAANEPASHGFVAFKIKLKNNVQVGDVITGDAGIYFDFNPPIITNMVHTQIVNPLSLADNPNPLNQITVYPNPTNKILNIFLTDNIQLEEVSIYNLQGKEVQKFQGKEKALNVENLNRGMYFLKITTDRGVVNRKLVKE